MQGLCLHRGGRFVERGELDLIPTPEETATWKPVPHGVIVDTIVDTAPLFNLAITSTKIGVSQDGAKMFGVAKIAGEFLGGMERMIGWRASNDKAIAFKGIGGCNVFVCDNMCMRGEYDVYRRHTSGLDVKVAVRSMYEKLVGEFKMLADNIRFLQAKPVNDDAVKLKIFEAMERNAISSSDILPVWKLWCEPPHEEFKPRNEWSLYNAFNERFKVMSPNRMAEAFEKIAPMFGMGRDRWDGRKPVETIEAETVPTEPAALI